MVTMYSDLFQPLLMIIFPRSILSLGWAMLFIQLELVKCIYLFIYLNLIKKNSMIKKLKKKNSQKFCEFFYLIEIKLRSSQSLVRS